MATKLVQRQALYSALLDCSGLYFYHCIFLLHTALFCLIFTRDLLPSMLYILVVALSKTAAIKPLLDARDTLRTPVCPHLRVMSGVL